jgi:hypothetical protein
MQHSLSGAPDRGRGREGKGEESDQLNILLDQTSLLTPQYIILKERGGGREGR